MIKKSFLECKNDFLDYIKIYDPLNKKIIKHDGNDLISKTTYIVNCYESELVNLYFKHFFQFVKSVLKRDYQLNSIWYQIYNKKSGSCHRYHTHNDKRTHVSGIYYAKLKSSEVITKFRLDGKEYRPNIKEGDLLLFDSRIPHTSPPNTTEHDKIIISFNLDLGLGKINDNVYLC